MVHSSSTSLQVYSLLGEIDRNLEGAYADDKVIEKKEEKKSLFIANIHLIE